MSQRAITFVEEFGIYRAYGGSVSEQATSLEGLLEKLDPGNEPASYFKAAGIIEHALGKRREGDHGQIQQGVVGA